MEPFTSVLVASLIMSSPDKLAKERAIIATYKQSGLEYVFNKKIENSIDKEYKHVLGYSYQLIHCVQNKEVTIGFSF